MNANDIIMAQVFGGGGSGGGGGGSMRLYGPYYATIDESIELPTGEATEVALDVIRDGDNHAVTYPSDPGAVTLLQSFYIGSDGISLIELDLPAYSEYDSQYYGACFFLYNGTGSSVTLDSGGAGINFYSTVEFPVNS